VLFVSHNMGAVSDLCNRAIYLNKGQVVLDGSTESVIRAYVKSNMLSNISDGAGLDDPTQRRGNGKVRFRRIEVINSEGKTDTEFIPHEKIIFRMEVIKNEPVETIYASVAFRSGRTREIITYTPKFTIPHQQIKPGEPFVFDIIVPDFNLHPGVYETYYWLGFESSETAYDVADNLLPPIVVNLPPGNDRLLGAGYYSLQAEFSMHQLH
jgi:hypothetical protein